jgi:hypothetical protein
LNVHTIDRRPPAAHSTSRWLLRTAIFALAVLGIACGSSTDAPPGVTGVWGARAPAMTQSDTFTFSFTQNGATVEGWGFVRPAGALAATKFSGTGTLSGGQLDLTLTDLDGAYTGLGPLNYYLRGALDRGRMNATFSFLTFSSRGTDTISYPITLRLAPPTASELTGTWALTSSTGAQAAPGNVVYDTIIANADRRAWRDRNSNVAGGPPIRTWAVWARNGNWLVIETESRDLWLPDSLLIQSGELQRTTVNGYGTRIDHYTRISTSEELP